MHLTPEELIDLAEGSRAESAAPHLQSCEMCRRQIIMLRATMSAAAGLEVPEPSPLFWDHLSERVRAAVDAGELPEKAFAGFRPWKGASPGSWRAWAIASIFAAVAISIYVTAPRTLTPRSNPRDRVAALSGTLEPFGASDDPSLTLFADLTEQMDPDAVAETGLGGHAGSIDEVVASLSDDERLELQRLLKEELAKS